MKRLQQHQSDELKRFICEQNVVPPLLRYTVPYECGFFEKNFLFIVTIWILKFFMKWDMQQILTLTVYSKTSRKVKERVLVGWEGTEDKRDIHGMEK